MERNPDFSGRHVVGESITLGHPRFATIVTGSRFERCDITITCPASGIIAHDNVFIDCTIQVKRFANFQFFYDGFDGCRLIGKFPGCEFGYRERLSGRQATRIRPQLRFHAGRAGSGELQ